MKRAGYWFFYFIECFKADTLRRPYWQILTVFPLRLVHFLSSFVCRRFCRGNQQKEMINPLFVKRFKSFMTEFPILLKPVH